jgi:hypothetical protein
MERSADIMYNEQGEPYEAPSQFIDTPTNSTADTPPTHAPLDFAGLCNLKKSVVGNLPKNCGHCGAELPPKSIVELKNGEIMAYCRKKGACGRSQTLFESVEFKSPIYEKVCIYETTPLEPGTTVWEMTRTALQQMETPTCAKCGKEREEHPQCDRNGWAVTGYNNLTKPSDWPSFDADTATWKK